MSTMGREVVSTCFMRNAASSFHYKLTDKGLKLLFEVERFRAFTEAFGLEL